MKKNRSLKTDEIIAIQDIILEYILSNEWKDYNNFVRLLSDRIWKAKSVDKSSLEKMLSRLSHSFFAFNDIPKHTFIERFPSDAIIHRMANMPKIAEQKVILISTQKKQIKKSKVTFEEIFPEVNKISIETAKSLIKFLNIEERIIQDALRDALREKNATNMTERKSDSSLEVADLEDFALEIKKRSVSFSSVVKGYRSISRIKFKEIAHQVMKANETQPDHILLVLAKPITDRVITNLVNYGIQCGNRNLVIIVDQVNLARFLRARGII